MTLEETISAIRPGDPAARDAARRWWDRLAKPLGSLGLLEEALVRVAALTGEEELQLSPRTLLVFCADNGVVAQGVTQTDSSVTAAVESDVAAGRAEKEAALAAAAAGNAPAGAPQAPAQPVSPPAEQPAEKPAEKAAKAPAKKSHFPGKQ